MVTEASKSKLRIWRREGGWSAISQLGLAEHSLCPMNPPAGPFTHRVEFYYKPRGKRRKVGVAEVHCPGGLKPQDEFYLWGLLGIIFAQPMPDITIYATPSYMNRELGLEPGGEQQRLLREALDRLGLVRYVSDDFYDPVSKERRHALFGFLSLSIPKDETSARGWRISVDPEFFRMCEVAGGYLQFDLRFFRELSKAGGRLFLYLKKQFYNRSRVSGLDPSHLAVHVLGYALNPKDGTKVHRKRLKQAAEELLACGVIESYEIKREGKGNFAATFVRGEYFSQEPSGRQALPPQRHALYEPLRTVVGLSDGHIHKVVAKYKLGLIQEWCDITIAKLERFGKEDFHRSPAAYFMDSVKKASTGERTPPDWWTSMLKDERTKAEVVAIKEGGLVREQEARIDDVEERFSVWLQTDGRTEYERLTDSMFGLFRAAGQSDAEAAREAAKHARKQMRGRFGTEDDRRSARLAKVGSVVDLGRIRQLNRT